jgi:hypothetical protein
MARAPRLVLSRLGLLLLLFPGASVATAAPAAPRPDRRFLVGVEGVAILTPAVHIPQLRLDSRFIGESTNLGGVGVLGRWSPIDRIALEIAVRSGSLRLRELARGDVISQDLVMADAGVLLYLARGELGRLAIDGGFGGIGHQLRYELGDGRRGLQRFGAFSARVGLDLELGLGRLALLVSLRAHGVINDHRRVVTQGALFAAQQAPLPVTTFQTYVVGAAGVAYRF